MCTDERCRHPYTCECEEQCLPKDGGFIYREEPVGTIKVEVDKRDGMVTAVFVGSEEVSCGDWWRTLLYRQGIYAIAVSSQRDGVPRLVLGWEVSRG